MDKFLAYKIFQDQALGQGRVTETALDELDSGDVVIKTAYAGVNYKDALAGRGAAKVIERFPCIGGIEAVGTVAASQCSTYREGDRVIVHGRGLGVKHDGGFSSYVRVPAEWIVPLPEGLDMYEAAVLGVAGHAAAVSIDLMELNGLSPGKGPVAVTGATGGAASLAIDMLSALGYEIAAVTRKTEAGDYLRKIGAARIIPAIEKIQKPRPLEKGEWAGAIDAAGGHILSWLLRTMLPNGVIAAFGNAAGIELHTTVLPFLLRGIRLIGVNSNTEIPYRRKIWQRLATDLKPRHAGDIAKKITLDALPDVMQRMLNGQITGRHIVAFD